MKHVQWIVAVGLAIGLASSPLAAPAPLKTTELGRGPTIVLLHSLGGSRTTWMPTARKLLGGHRVVMMDLPGHGQSPLPEPFTLDVAAEAVAQTLAALKAESTIVVGQGTGGVLALMALAAHPERARGLVVIDASLRFEPRIPDQQQRQFLQQMDEHYDDVLRMMFTRMGRDSAQGVAIHAQAAQVPPTTVKAYIREALNFDGTRWLKALKSPLLFVGTGRTWAADQDWAAVAKQRGFDAVAPIPARRIADCGTLVASEQPDSLAAVVSEFAARAIAAK